MRRVLTAMLVMTMAAGCGGVDLGEPVDSGVEGVPIPASAERVQLASSVVATWRLTDGSFSDLRAWYDEQMPEGAAFGAWEWCDLGGSDEIIGRIYHQPDTTRILGVTITDDEQPGIVIAADDSGPC